MKKVSLILLVLVWFNSFSQSNKPLPVKASTEIREKIILTSPGLRSISVFSDFFNTQITKKLLSQVTEQELQSIILNCNESKYPNCIRKVLEYNYSDPDSDAKSNKLLKSLKLYRIAKFNNVQNGTNFGEYAVLIAPALENKNVTDGCSYTKDFYILIPTKGITISRQ